MTTQRRFHRERVVRYACFAGFVTHCVGIALRSNMLYELGLAAMILPIAVLWLMIFGLWIVVATRSVVTYFHSNRPSR